MSNPSDVVKDTINWTPIILLVVGTFLSYMAWASKKILQNQEDTLRNISDTLKETSKVVADHTIEIMKINILFDSLRSDFRDIKADVDYILGGGKILKINPRSGSETPQKDS